MADDDRSRGQQIVDRTRFMEYAARRLGLTRHTPEQMAGAVPFRPDGSPTPTPAQRKASAEAAARRDAAGGHHMQPDAEGRVQMTRRRW